MDDDDDDEVEAVELEYEQLVELGLVANGDVDDLYYQEEFEIEEDDDDDDEEVEVVEVEGGGGAVAVVASPPRVSTSAAVDDGRRRRENGGEATTSMTWQGSNRIEGLFCPICMDAWSSGGDHQVCCLPCGHLYGARCIKKWLQRKNSGKCPQCNRRCSLKDIRIIYAPQIVAIDYEIQKKVESLEAKCASLEKKNKYWEDEEVKWRKREGDLNLQLHQLTKRACDLESSLQNMQSSSTGFLNAGEGCREGFACDTNFSVQQPTCSFVLQNVLQLDGARLFDIDASSQSVIVARRLHGRGGSHALTKMSLMAPHEGENIQLPANSKAIRELRVAPDGRLALLTSSGKKLSLMSTESNNFVLSYDLPVAGWSCSWDISSSHYLYSGLQNGMLMVFDMRQTKGPWLSMSGLTSNPVHSIHSLAPDTGSPSGVTSILTASSAGLCHWNFRGTMERPSLVPESQDQGVCIASAYCESSNQIVASFRPKVTLYGDDVPASQPLLTPAPSFMGQVVLGSHVLYKRVGNRIIQKLDSTCANVDSIRLPRCAVIGRRGQKEHFACGDESTRELILQDLPSLLVGQRLQMWKQPIRDVRYTQDIGSGLLGCLSDETLQIFISSNS